MFAQLPDLTQMEYYFDTDPGFGNGTQVSFTADSIVDVDFNVDLSSVDVGYHKLFIRIKDEHGKWSLIYKQGVYKSSTPAVEMPLPDLTQMEYYFDTDPGFGNGFQIPITSDSLVNVDFEADLSSVDVGYHKLFVRTKDENGKWSLIYKQGIYKSSTPAVELSLPDLTQMEYYFDTDPGFGNGFQIPITSDSLVNVDFEADLSSVDVGYHKLFVRTKDENGKWSLIYKQGIYKSSTPAVELPLPDLTQMEYYFDTDPGFGNGFQIPITADSLVDVDFNADLSSVDVGYHKLFVRTKDENGKWSLIYKQGVYKSSTPAVELPLPDLTLMEYYFDTDPGFGNGTPVPFSSDSLIDKEFRADLTPLADGMHQLYVRVKDENNKWSLIYTEEIEKVIPNRWLGTVDTVWSNPANWSDNVVPTSVDFIVILNVLNHPVISGITGECYEIDMKSGSVLTVKNNGTLNVTGE